MFFHTGRLRVYADPEMAWTLDGEYASGCRCIDVSCERGAVRLAVKDPETFLHESGADALPGGEA